MIPYSNHAASHSNISYPGVSADENTIVPLDYVFVNEDAAMGRVVHQVSELR